MPRDGLSDGLLQRPLAILDREAPKVAGCIRSTIRRIGTNSTTDEPDLISIQVFDPNPDGQEPRIHHTKGIDVNLADYTASRIMLDAVFSSSSTSKSAETGWAIAPLEPSLRAPAVPSGTEHSCNYTWRHEAA